VVPCHVCVFLRPLDDASSVLLGKESTMGLLLLRTKTQPCRPRSRSRQKEEFSRQNKRCLRPPSISFGSIGCLLFFVLIIDQSKAIGRRISRLAFHQFKGVQSHPRQLPSTPHSREWKAFSSFGFAQPSSTSAVAEDNEVVSVMKNCDQENDNRPFEQRVERPRPARRMNHPFKYLYRHHDTNATSSSTGGLPTTEPALNYLMQEGGFTREQVLKWNSSFPVLLDLSVQRQLAPKMRFLKETLGVTDPATIYKLVPPHYFGSRLERTVAPRHAFLVWSGLPSGRALFQEKLHQDQKLPMRTTTLCKFQDFMLACRKTKHFSTLCESWRREHGGGGAFQGKKITAKDIEAFDAIFSRGLLAAVRDELVQFNNTWPIEQLPTLKAFEVVKLLIDHGANPLARDYRGATLLHWACGRGHWDAAIQLLPYSAVNSITERDGATPLHWAAAGVSSREFGLGGHVRVCENLLEQVRHSPEIRLSAKDYVNCLTFDGNSALMWAAWSGTLDSVKLLVRNRADTEVRNRNGCTVAHWAASGGSLPTCQYLANTANVDFMVQNDNGNTPLSHAVAFGRTAVVQWLLSLSSQEENNTDEVLAYSLAQDFVQWTDGADVQRKRVLQLFEDDDWLPGGC